MTFAPRYTVYWTNFGYTAGDRFDSAEAALAYAKSKCFEASIIDSGTGRTEYTYSPIGGVKPILHRS